MTNLNKFKDDLKVLQEQGDRLLIGLVTELGLLEKVTNKEEVLKKIKPLDFKRNYESWYTEALTFITQLVPNRVEDFTKLYKNDKRKDVDFLSYTISDHVIGLVTRRNGEIRADGSAALPKFQQQIAILSAVEKRFISSLFDIKHIVQADLFDDEVTSANELKKKGFLRASGTICGVVIEKHLAQVCNNHKIETGKKNPSISDYNDVLKSNDVIDISLWRQIQRLADIRNLCCHNKDKEPQIDDLDELINGTDKIIKTIF